MGVTGEIHGSKRAWRWAPLAGLIAIAALSVLPSSASAAPCPLVSGSTTAWIAGSSGSFNDDNNWSNGGPSPACDASITQSGTYTVTMTGGSSMKSLTFGGSSGKQTLVISAEGPNTNLNATTTGISINPNAAIVLTCPALPTGCNGGAAGGPTLNAFTTTITNEGAITVAAAAGTGTHLSGSIVNTGTMQFDQSALHDNGTLVNQGPLGIADGKTLFSRTSHCGDNTGTVFKNDAGGSIVAAGTGTLDVYNYEQGNGSTSGANPVQMPCGSLKYSGDGASTVMAYGGFTLTGEMKSNQSLTVNAQSNNTNVTLGGDFTNNGSISLSCFVSGCNGGDPGGGAGFNVSNKDFVNAGTFTVAAASGTGAGLGANFEGSITNTGTLNFNQSAGLGGPVVNQGAINIADGKTATSSGSSCGDTGGNVKNDTGGSINAAGSGTLSVLNYEQGAGTTSGSRPVQIPCGSLKYSGNGASVVQVGGASMSGNIGSAQTMRLVTNVNTGAFTNAGTIVLDQSGNSPSLNNGGTLTNIGTVVTSGPSANTSSVNGAIDQTGSSAQVVVPAGTKLSPNGGLALKAGRLSGAGTISGSVDNSGGTVAPGQSPGTLTLSGNYTQGGGGKLEIEVDGAGAGQFDKLAVGGNATLGGTLVLQPSSGYAAASKPGDSVAFLTYGGSRTDSFSSTSVSPSLDCPKQFTAAYNEGAKSVSASVSSSGAVCAKPTSPTTTPPQQLVIPDTVLDKHPRSVVKTKKSKASVTFAFSADIAGATFECRLDKQAFKSCSSPKSYSVKLGKHKFTVRAVGPGGADPEGESFSFKVVKKKAKKK